MRVVNCEARRSSLVGYGRVGRGCEDVCLPSEAAPIFERRSVVSMRGVAATALDVLLSAGDAPGKGPGPFETLFGLPGLPSGLKEFGKGLDDPDYKPTEGDLIEMLGDMAPLPIGPAKETFQEGRKNVDSYNKNKNDRIDRYNRHAKGTAEEGE